LDLCADMIKINSDSNLINFGSGLGGPARYFGGKYHSKVLAIELQEDLHRTANELTERCGLKKNVYHMAGEFLQIAEHLRENAYSHIVSWLTILHIKDRAKLFELVRMRIGFYSSFDGFVFSAFRFSNQEESSSRRILSN